MRARAQGAQTVKIRTLDLVTFEAIGASPNMVVMILEAQFPDHDCLNLRVLCFRSGHWPSSSAAANQAAREDAGPLRHALDTVLMAL